jgi:hypothetical protein
MKDAANDAFQETHAMECNAQPSLAQLAPNQRPWLLTSSAADDACPSIDALQYCALDLIAHQRDGLEELESAALSAPLAGITPTQSATTMTTKTAELDSSEDPIAKTQFLPPIEE